jgi:formamidopyrimidine-DNA glycosylase
MKAMKLMTSLQLLALVPWGRALTASRGLTSRSTSFSGQPWAQRRSLARQSAIRMMPEGPEVRTIVDQLQGGVGRRLVDIQFLSGRYIRHGRPDGFEAFSKTITPTTFQPPHNPTPAFVDIIQEWRAKGKFIYITLDDGSDPPEDADDFQRSIWVTLGMTGQFVNEQIHQEDPRFARWYVELMDVQSGSTHRVYYHDIRNFGTLKFCLSREGLTKKLASLGSDILDDDTTEEDFLTVVSSQRNPNMNICKFLMDQSVRLSGLLWPTWVMRNFISLRFFLSHLFVENMWSWKLHSIRMPV